MGFVLVESLAKNKSRFVQMSCKIMELLLLSVGLISMVVVMKDSLSDFVFSIFLGFWAFITCFFSSPPTVIIAINLMVLLIFASSTFCRRHDPHPHPDPHHTSHEITILDHVDDDLQVNPRREPPPTPAPTAPPLPPPPAVPATQPAALDVETANPLQRGGSYYDATRHPLPSPKPQPPSSRAEAAMRNNATLGGKRCDTHDVSASQLPPPKVPEPTPPPQPEKGKDVVIEESDRRNGEEDTLEATWEAITGGGGGKKQQMKKKRAGAVKKKSSSTWVDVERVRRLDSEEVVPSSPKWKELRKAETFNDAVSLTRRGGLIRKVPSMSLEDFNHKVEAFINGFNSTLRHKSKRTFFDIINQKRR